MGDQIGTDFLSYILSTTKNCSTASIMGFPGGTMVKNLQEMQETWVPSLGQKILLEKKIATHPIILVWEISQTEESDELQSMGSQGAGHD